MSNDDSEDPPLTRLMSTWAVRAARASAVMLDGACEGLESASALGGLVTDAAKQVELKVALAGMVTQDQLSPIGHEGSVMTVPWCTTDRLARLVVRALNESITRQAGLPDVLGIASRFMANPALPTTETVARFGSTMALKALYRASYSPRNVLLLRNAHSSLLRGVVPRSLGEPEEIAAFADLMADLLCLNGWAFRAGELRSYREYCRAFQRTPLGVADRRRQPLSPIAISSDGAIEFATIVNLLFSQPTGIPGFDDVTGGLLAPIPDENAGSQFGGLVTLVAGPPGSGKTSLCLALAGRMAELGSHVRYITVEESSALLHAKLQALGSTLRASMLGMSEVDSRRRMKGEIAPRLIARDARELQSLPQIADYISEEFRFLNRFENAGQSQRGAAYLAFPRVVIIDSLRALLEVTAAHSTQPQVARANVVARRRELAEVLKRIRKDGVCLFLIGSPDDTHDEGLAYLVDNVIALELDSAVSYRHPQRVLNVEKTRIQASSRGRHVFHIGGSAGCSVSPALHTVLSKLEKTPIVQPSREHEAVFIAAGSQLSLSGVGGPIPTALKFGAHSQVLVFGHGSSGKARLALTLAVEPRQPRLNERQLQALGDRRSKKKLIPAERQTLSSMRVLVVSFLYDVEYYARIYRKLMLSRYGLENHDGLSVAAFYPGMISPEAVVAKVRGRLLAAELEGRPFSAVVVDGVHNLMMQFPLLEKEPLLWPTLSRQLRVSGIEGVTTFTFFQMRSAANERAESRLQRFTEERRTSTPAAGGRLAITQELYFHLLLSSADFSVSIEESSREGEQREFMVQMVQGFEPDIEESAIKWDPSEFRFVLPE